MYGYLTIFFTKVTENNSCRYSFCIKNTFYKTKSTTGEKCDQKFVIVIPTTSPREGQSQWSVNQLVSGQISYPTYRPIKLICYPNYKPKNFRNRRQLRREKSGMLFKTNCFGWLLVTPRSFQTLRASPDFERSKLSPSVQCMHCMGH